MTETRKKMEHLPNQSGALHHIDCLRECCLWGEQRPAAGDGPADRYCRCQGDLGGGGDGLEPPLRPKPAKMSCCLVSGQHFP